MNMSDVYDGYSSDFGSNSGVTGFMECGVKDSKDILILAVQNYEAPTSSGEDNFKFWFGEISIPITSKTLVL